MHRGGFVEHLGSLEAVHLYSMTVIHFKLLPFFHAVTPVLSLTFLIRWLTDVNDQNNFVRKFCRQFTSAIVLFLPRSFHQNFKAS